MLNVNKPAMPQNAASNDLTQLHGLLSDMGALPMQSRLNVKRYVEACRAHGETPDLVARFGKNFANTWLVGIDLSGVQMKGINLQGANLRGANLSGANL